MLPKIPHASTRSAGTAPAYALACAASAQTTSYAGRRVLEGGRGEHRVELDQAAGDVGAPRVIAEHAEQIASFTRARTDRPDRTRWHRVERVAHVALHDAQALCKS